MFKDALLCDMKRDAEFEDGFHSWLENERYLVFYK